jgi:hypothetical protein
LEFSELQLISNPELPRLVYTDSEEHVYKWNQSSWRVTILNRNPNPINPPDFVIPVGPNLFGREVRYRETLAELLEHTDDLRVDPKYWASVDNTPSRTPVPDLTPASPTLSEFQATRLLSVPTCHCGIDLCECDYKYPDTPPTPPSVFLWKPREERRPIAGLHYQRHRNSLQSG